MTISETVAPARRRRSAWVVHGLGLYVLVIYGVTYYAIGAAAPLMAKELGTTTSAIFAVLGGALLLNALAAPRIGRFVDRIGAGPVLLAGAVLRAVAVFALALSPEIWTFAAALIVIQCLAQPTEYDAAFAAAVQADGAEARTSVSMITLWGGLASTAFWPLTALLLQHTSWRGALSIYAGLMLCVCIPVALAVMAQARIRRTQAAPPPPAPTPSAAIEGGRIATDPATAFIPLAIAFSLASVAMGMPVIMPPLLEGLGLGAGAVVAGMVFGPSQTAGRFFELVLGRNLSPLTIAVISTALLPLSLVVLVAGGANTATAVAFAVLFGAGAGVSYVVRGTVVLALFGPASYGSWLGRLARIRLVVAAATPFALALILEHYGAAAALLVCAATSALATLAFAYVWRRHA